MKNQKEYTEEILFDNYMVSSLGEEKIHCQIPFYFEKNIYDSIVHHGEAVNEIALKVLSGINDKHKRLLNYFEDFNLKDKIFNLRCTLAPMFWTRFDTFRDNENNIYFSEFNYDKPCGQKEMALAGKSDFKGNINKEFINNLKDELVKICSDFSKEKIINVAFLVDPCHYEELYHSYYFKDILKDTNINIISAGPTNLSVKNNFVYVYDEIKVDIILRLFPIEFNNEILNIEEILNVFEKGNVLIINDPRIIAIQAKGFFAYLWDLIKENSNLLNDYEKTIIKSCIPYTEIIDFNMQTYEELVRNKDKYVIKSSLGRYSLEVYIGCLYSEENWKSTILSLMKKNKVYIRQDFINIRKEYTYISDGENMTIPQEAYGNFGIYIMNKSAIGMLVRWSTNFLTDDNYTWMCPLGYCETPMRIQEYYGDDHDKILEEVCEESAFKYSFTGSFTNIYEYISLDIIVMKKSLQDELYYAGQRLCSIFKKTFQTVKDNLDIFIDILGIPKSLYKVIKESCIEELCAIGRIDFALDNDNNLKILEFNSETPAGLVEAIGINLIVQEKLNLKFINPNYELRNCIKENLKNIIEELKKRKPVKNIAVVTTWYYEDIYTANIISEIIKELKEYNVIFGNIYDLKKKNNKLYLYDKEIQAVYRHYPLDWFEYDKEMNPIIEILESGDYLINSADTLIIQSKAYFALIYELIGKNFFNEDEEQFIKKYIPYTCLKPNKKLSHDYIVKPFLSREGNGIKMSYEKIEKSEEDLIYQDRVNTKPFFSNVYSSMDIKQSNEFPIIGLYICDENPCGFYVRRSSFITDKNAVFMPIFIEND